MTMKSSLLVSVLVALSASSFGLSHAAYADDAAAPAATTSAPVATTPAPVATTPEPAATPSAPVATPSAPVATTPAPVATTAAAIHPRGEALLKTFIDEVMQSKTEMTHLTPLLRVNLDQQTGLIAALTTRLQILGPMTALTFVGVQNGFQIYDVRFTKGASVWSVAFVDGQISRIHWQFH